MQTFGQLNHVSETRTSGCEYLHIITIESKENMKGFYTWLPPTASPPLMYNQEQSIVMPVREGIGTFLCRSPFSTWLRPNHYHSLLSPQGQR